jgi:hypothetical protein
VCLNYVYPAAHSDELGGELGQAKPPRSREFYTGLKYLCTTTRRRTFLALVRPVPGFLASRIRPRITATFPYASASRRIIDNPAGARISRRLRERRSRAARNCTTDSVTNRAARPSIEDDSHVSEGPDGRDVCDVGGPKFVGARASDALREIGKDWLVVITVSRRDVAYWRSHSRMSCRIFLWLTNIPLWRSSARTRVHP